MVQQDTRQNAGGGKNGVKQSETPRRPETRSFDEAVNVYQGSNELICCQGKQREGRNLMSAFQPPDPADHAYYHNSRTGLPSARVPRSVVCPVTLYPLKNAIIICSLWYNMPVCVSSLLMFLLIFRTTAA